MELYFNYCSDVHELRLTTLVHNCHLSVPAGGRLSHTDSESESALRTQGQTCVIVSDRVLTPGHNAASLPSGQLGLNDCICASDGQLFISSNLKLRPT
jgi:hypothetical protein